MISLLQVRKSNNCRKFERSKTSERTIRTTVCVWVCVECPSHHYRRIRYESKSTRCASRDCSGTSAITRWREGFTSESVARPPTSSNDFSKLTSSHTNSSRKYTLRHSSLFEHTNLSNSKVGGGGGGLNSGDNQRHINYDNENVLGSILRRKFGSKTVLLAVHPKKTPDTHMCSLGRMRSHDALFILTHINIFRIPKLNPIRSFVKTLLQSCDAMSKVI